MRFVLKWLASIMLPPFLTLAISAQEPVAMKIPAPELKGIDEWINSKPLQLKALKGKVVVLHFWTFG